METNKEYIGKVIYIDDVTHTGRCKIRVFSLFDDLPDENIPWFTPGNINVFSSDGGGNIDIPKVGSIVRVKFSNNDFYSGEYFTLPMLDPNLVKEIEDDYEDTHVLLYDGDQELLIIYQKMTGLKIFHKDASIILDPTGNIRLEHRNKQTHFELNDNNIILTTGQDTGTVEISSGNTVNISAKNINLNADNIRIGKGGMSRNFACANTLQTVLAQIVKELAAKQFVGSELEGHQFNEIKIDNVYCD